LSGGDEAVAHHQRFQDDDDDGDEDGRAHPGDGDTSAQPYLRVVCSPKGQYHPENLNTGWGGWAPMLWLQSLSATRTGWERAKVENVCHLLGM
jgi:hypothetical protein